ncbi:RNA-binding S4 domain-containing protein [Aeromicrobium sp.]|uniref:RNA-binding S4 domain-containing protein n=1 Tax=Aeromicrobium sp. TaxID=1871063 RepID=UPI0019A6A2F7|nr:RNA-binding S4 domain-containing protein [Aeromicrobium sp.]MBC7632334.1 RNA-binding S4 domain-containing protein [Aeromicrobium sp.]
MDTTRADVWTSSVRLYRTRSLASAACRAGHVRINGAKAKPAQPVRVGDRVEALTDGGMRTVVVARIIVKRVGAGVAVECYVDHTPAPPPKEEVALMPRRDRGAGRPTKRDRRALDRLRRR